MALRWEGATTPEEAIAQLVELNSPERCASAFSTAVQLVEAAISDRARFGTIKAGAKTIRSRILDLSGGALFFESAGFRATEEAHVLDKSLDEAELRRRVGLIKRASARAEAVLSAVVGVGDRNAPAVAVGAVKLARTYAHNILTQEADESKRRISASNKSLAARLLSAAGGAELLAAVGFAARADPANAGDSFVCEAPPDELRVALATLDKAEDVWANLAARAGVKPLLPGETRTRTADGDATRVAEPVALSSIVVAELPPASSLAAGRMGVADMEPALVSDESRSAVLLFCWMGVSKQWRQFARMQTPSTTVEWVRPMVAGAHFELVIEVDLGDGKPLELGYHVQEGGPENEYVAANRFIGQHLELNANFLEEIARNVRNRVAPVLQTIKNLIAAMEAQF